MSNIFIPARTVKMYNRTHQLQRIAEGIQVPNKYVKDCIIVVDNDDIATALTPVRTTSPAELYITCSEGAMKREKTASALTLGSS